VKEIDKKRALALILMVQVAIIVWLLTRRVMAVQRARQAPGGVNVNIDPAGFSVGPFSVGLNTDPQNYNLIYGFTDPTPTASSCDCGCDEDGPLNVAQQNLARFVNQYQTGLFNAQQGFLSQIANAVPDWMQQYINSGGGVYGTGLFGGGV
jgi:hypothetical protein